jgi:membrane-bound serine protease (ClpP class)
MDSNAIFAVLLLIAGIGILCAEVFIPSGGILGMITFAVLLCSLVFAWRAWGTSNPNVFWSFCVVLLMLVPTSIGTAFYFLPRTAIGRRVLLEAPSEEHVTPFVEESNHLHELVGKFGKSASPLNPGGLVTVNGERLHAVSEGLVIQSGQSIQVLDVRGARLVVRPAEPPAEVSGTTSAEQKPKLDFDFPQS